MNDPTSINYKGLLQEYCQKLGKAIPTYETYKEENFGFTCTLRTFFGTFTTATYLPSKKAAEKLVAKVGYESIETAPPYDIIDNDLQPRKKLRVEGRVLVLIDLENYPNIDISEFLTTDFPDVRFISFYGKCSSQAKNEKKLCESLPFTELHKVNFARSDGVDHFISVYAGFMLAKNIYSHIIIMSSDKFAASTMDSIREITTSDPEVSLKSVHHVSSAHECFECLLNLGELTNETNGTNN